MAGTMVSPAKVLAEMQNDGVKRERQAGVPNVDEMPELFRIRDGKKQEGMEWRSGRRRYCRGQFVQGCCA